MPQISRRIEGMGRKALNRYKELYGADPLSEEEASALGYGPQDRLYRFKLRDHKLGLREFIVRDVKNKIPTATRGPNFGEKFTMYTAGFIAGVLASLAMQRGRS